MPPIVEDHSYPCPHCWQLNTVLIERPVDEVTRIEDCEVCCNPVELYITTDASGNISVSAYAAQ